jgi:hypothetical protein
MSHINKRTFVPPIAVVVAAVGDVSTTFSESVAAPREEVASAIAAQDEEQVGINSTPTEGGDDTPAKEETKVDGAAAKETDVPTDGVAAVPSRERAAEADVVAEADGPTDTAVQALVEGADDVEAGVPTEGAAAVSSGERAADADVVGEAGVPTEIAVKEHVEGAVDVEAGVSTEDTTVAIVATEPTGCATAETAKEEAEVDGAAAHDTGVPTDGVAAEGSGERAAEADVAEKAGVPTKLAAVPSRERAAEAEVADVEAGVPTEGATDDDAAETAGRGAGE